MEADPSTSSGRSQASSSQGDVDIIPNQAVRMETRLCAAHKAGFRDEEFEAWSVQVALVDLAQSAEWGGIAVDALPALLRKQKIYDLVSGQLLGEVGAWVAQGFPHPAALGVSLAVKARFSFRCGHNALQLESTKPAASSAAAAQTSPGSCTEFSRNDRLSWVGNAMNVLQISAWLVHVLQHVGKLR